MSGSTRLDQLAAQILPLSDGPRSRADPAEIGAHDSLLPKYHETTGQHRRQSSIVSLASSAARPGGRRRVVVVAIIVLLAAGLSLSRHEQYGYGRWEERLAWRGEQVDELREPLFHIEDGIVRLPDRPPDPPPPLNMTTSPLLPPPSSVAGPEDDQTPASPLGPPSPSVVHLSAASSGLLPINVTPLLYFSPPPSHPLHLLTFSRLSASSRWSCLEAWVAEGQVCRELEGRFSAEKADRARVDVVWTWVNGSEPRLGGWRERLAEEGAQKKGGKDNGKEHNGAQVIRHFREHDELRYSIRSVLTSLSGALASLHLVTGDIPAEAPTDESFDVASTNLIVSRLQQVPTWLAFSSATSPHIRLHPHSELFRTRAATGDVNVQAAAERWQNSTVPSFNSLAIESQLPSFETNSPAFLFLNDDCFLLKTVSATDVASPLTGPVFRIYRNFVAAGVSAKENTVDGADSEWLGLKHSNWLLDQRFGKRPRPYLAHIAKSVSAPIFREVREVFFEAFSDTAAARFRGRGPEEITPLFFYTHYTIEKHREALLYSYLVLRFDEDSDGLLSPEERTLLLIDMLTDVHTFDQASYSLYSHSPRRTSPSSLASSSTLLGLPPPKQTKLEFLSSDGYAFFAAQDDQETIPRWRDWPHFSAGSDVGSGLPCTMRLKTCFGDEFLDIAPGAPASRADALLKRVAFERPECGDCLIVHLLSKSGDKGLEAFLPKDGPAGGQAELEVVTVGTSRTKWEDVEYLAPESVLSRRQQALSLIQRYAYALGSSPLAFLSITSASKLTEKLNALTSRVDGPAFLALNDDIGTTEEDELREIDQHMKRWFNETWPVPSVFERDKAGTA
ncbi:hypothetical protein JCM11251_003886 [Rhodosporidiobolus azoricus]